VYPRICFPLCILSLLAVACGEREAASDTKELVLWKHQTGEAEELGNRELIERFNASQEEWSVKAQSIPQRAYTESIMASSMAGNMPCILTVDHPKVPSFVWAGHLMSLDDVISEEIVDAVSPTALGTFRGSLYSVGQFDAAIALYVRRSDLELVDARIPSIEEPWSRDEFDKILRDLKASGKFDYPLDLWTRDGFSDWWTYGFSPILQSFGGDLIDREGMQEAEGILNGPKAIEFARWFQSLFVNGYVNRTEPDERAFQKHRVAISYTGNWWAPDFEKTVGDDLLILPPPDFGEGPVIGGGSWQWAISASCEHPEGAAAFLKFLMRPEEIAAMSKAAGMIPVSEDAAALTVRYSKDGEWRIFFDLMQSYARLRPETPAFSTISNAYFRAMKDIMNGKNVRNALDDAVDDIERVIEDNNGYKLEGDVG